MAQAPGAIVSTLLKKATPEQRVAAAHTLCEKEEGGSSALDVRKAVRKSLGHEAKAWLEQARRVADVPLDAAPGSRVELQQRSGDGAARMLVRREGGWCGESGTVCDLADEVLGQSRSPSSPTPTVLKIVIYGENHPHRPGLWLADYHPLGG